jgi:hypothetical protein
MADKDKSFCLVHMAEAMGSDVKLVLALLGLVPGCSLGPDLLSVLSSVLDQLLPKASSSGRSIRGGVHLYRRISGL